MANCPVCSHSVNPGAKFCANCGGALSANTPSGIATKRMGGLSEQVGNFSSKPSRFSSTASSKKSIPIDTIDAVKRTIFVVPDWFASSFQVLLDENKLNPISVIALDSSDDMTETLRDLPASYAAAGINYIVIIGDWESLAPARIPSPLAHDGDAFCLTDSPHHFSDDSEDEEWMLDHLAHIQVGRIPVPDIDIIHNLFSHAESIARNTDPVSLAVSAECWAEATHEIVRSQGGGTSAKQVAKPINRHLLPKIPVVLSPGWSEEDLVPVLDISKTEEQIILFNVHGMADEPNWIGESIDREYIQIFSPERIQDFSKTILVTEACYGGALGYDTISITEDFFHRGGLAFLGSSTIAYGSNSSNLGAADLMAKHFIEKVNQGETFGEALNHARKTLEDDDPFIDDYSKKTILSFNLFGLPWMKKTVAKSTLGRFSGSSSGSVLANARASLANRASGTGSGVLGQARQRYRSRMSQINQGFLANTPEMLEKLRTFRDYDKITSSLNQLLGKDGFIQLESVEAAGQKGYRIGFKSHENNGSKKQGVIVTDADGRIKKMLSSK